MSRSDSVSGREQVVSVAGLALVSADPARLSGRKHIFWRGTFKIFISQAISCDTPAAEVRERWPPITWAPATWTLALYPRGWLSVGWVSPLEGPECFVRHGCSRQLNNQPVVKENNLAAVKLN
jgi:hypothetical protein